ncbi:MAG: signal peptidase II [Gemmatimonadales bacterium]
MPNGADRRVTFWLVAALVVALDLVTKWWAETSLVLYQPIQVVGDWIRWRLIYNPGAAFGLHLGPWSRWIFLVIAVVAVVVLYRLARSSSGTDLVRQVSLGAVTGGAIGNLVDRIRGPQGVVDFLDVGVGATRWPTFNIADIGVSCGAVVLAVSLWREDSQRAASTADG